MHPHKTKQAISFIFTAGAFLAPVFCHENE